MTGIVVEQQTHGYLKGHQLLSSSLKLPREDQDLVDRVSDISGQLRPKETFPAYLTAYPLPSRAYFVLARTWQDLDAPRTGCVLTRSLLVPMPAWERLTTLQPLLDLLVPVERGDKVRTVNLSVSGPRPPSPVSEAYTLELTEALFLEARMPTLVLDTTRAEAAAVRILAAIWPRLRRSFAVCTYALAPRRIEGRDFDLLFAPRSARMRFAEWRGRRIEGGSSAPRHRWSVATAFQIFESPDPRLSGVDRLGLLDGPDDGDDGNLRLVLLWNELSAKAEEAPTAVLGLLDIANSQGENGERARTDLAPAAVRALSLSREQLPAAEAWRFTTTLLGKFPDGAPDSVVQSAETVSVELAQRDPTEALQFLQAEASQDRLVPDAMLAGIARGLAEREELDGLAPAFAAVSPGHALAMIAASPELARQLAWQAKRDPAAWIEPLARALRQGDPPLALRVADNLLPNIDDGRLAPVLGAILADADPARLAQVARSIGESTGFEVPPLSEALVSAATSLAHRQRLRVAVAGVSDGPVADALLLRTLGLDAESVAWLAGLELTRPRALRLLLALLKTQSDHAIASVAADAASRARLTDILSRDLAAGAEALARVVVLSRAPLAEALAALDKIGGVASGPMLRWMAAALLERAFFEGASSQRLQQLLNAGAVEADGAALIRQALPNGAPVNRWAANLVALNSSPTAIRSRIVAYIDFLTERLISGTRDNLGREAYDAWAALLADAEKSRAAAHERAAIQVLDFALSHPRFPLGALARVSFPPVHARLPKSRSSYGDSLLVTVLTMPLAMFGEIDRAKSARRALVHAFMHSDWPPAQLVLAGLDAGVEQKLLKLVAREYRGEAYLRAIGRDADTLPASTRGRVLHALERFDPDDVSWLDD